MDAETLDLPDATFDVVLCSLGLMYLPDPQRAVREWQRVLKPGGRLVIVDYHRPHRLNPLRPLMALVLRTLEPYALDLWRHELAAWLPHDRGALRKRTLFGGLYQLVTITAPVGNTQ
jgi:ubiquinone/menaquinone biosynthesis C-methylase UbiE